MILVEPEVCWTQVGGALWWRRWSAPRYAAHVWMVLPWLAIPLTDLIIDDGLGDTLDDWDAGRFTWAGETLDVEWLSPRESRELVATEFGR
ncbi:hypothetical protein FNH05_07470 [Amycolatopsis rhizosphaerae]|uniref:Uncharacterized protein n=1 Tax=Amycolatopsis rhizosphaerae TaxID=2053003 RepID=A0A558D8R6_9PSEU|nr:hypothetical protein [Amycolatopsis rhizosphaerae]TVT57408.1 hypothetical protein FNH05_07470 [Amycolatopsis rhizosphaerae]